MGLYRLDLTYRTASNYKTHFEVNVNSQEHPGVLNLKGGMEITMGEYGTLPQDKFFNSSIHPYPYQDDDDHNIIEVNSVELLNYRSDY